MQVEGESLFNDGVGLVIFVTIFTVAFSGEQISASEILHLFLHEAIGGIIFGFVLGLVAHLLISATDDGSLEILLTLTIQLPAFMLANLLKFPVHWQWWFGIMVGNWTRHRGFSEQSQRYLDHFWEMIDHFPQLTAILPDPGFALLLIDFTFQGFLMMLLAIPVCLAARYISLWLPYSLLRFFRTYEILIH